MSASRLPIVVEMPDGSFAISFDDQCTVTWKREGDMHVIRGHADADGEFTIKEGIGPPGTNFSPGPRIKHAACFPDHCHHRRTHGDRKHRGIDPSTWKPSNVIAIAMPT